MISADRITRIGLMIAACALGALALIVLSSGCASIPDPPMPEGVVNRQIVLDYQTALIDADRARDARSKRITRTLNIVCQSLDVGTTLVAVHRYDAREMNPLLPDPKKNTEAFIAVKFSIAWLLDRSARQGHHGDVRLVSTVTCGAALWNIGQMLR